MANLQVQEFFDSLNAEMGEIRRQMATGELSIETGWWKLDFLDQQRKAALEQLVRTEAVRTDPAPFWLLGNHPMGWF